MIASGYVSAQGRAETLSFNNSLQLGASAAGVSDELVIAVQSLSGAVTVYASVMLREHV